MPKITVFLKRKPVSEHTFTGDIIKIGRHPESEIFLANQTVSRNHATIEQIGDGWILQETGGSNGLWVNGQRAKERGLKNGDKIEVGAYLLHFELTQSERLGDLYGIDPGQETKDQSKSAPLTAKPTGIEAHDATFMLNPTEILAQRKNNAKNIMPHLEWVDDDGNKMISNFTAKKVVLGTGDDAQIQLPDAITVSKAHATFEYTAEGFTVTPCSWWGPIKINGTRVKETQLLKDGDKLKVGPFEMVFRDALFKKGRR